MAPAIPPPDVFPSTRHPGRKILYRRLTGPDVKHTLLFCYGAGSHSALTTLFKPFLDQHPDLEILCVDRWALPVPTVTSSSSVSRSGLGIFEELTDITIELLQSLNISELSMAAHSAGVYQMLHLAQSCQEIPTLRVTHLFPLCTHIPASFCGSQFLDWMRVMPSPLFKTLTRVDSSFGESWLGTWMAGVNTKSIATAQSRKQLSNYKASADETRARSERQDLDYRIIYEHFEGIDHGQLVNIYRALTMLAPKTKVVWFTSDRDAFFGPSSVSRLLLEIQAESDVEVFVVDGATHADIHESRDVWENIIQSLGLAKKCLD
ncbi:hypothetical protein M409DRAFT_59196 [Zasmidium cellare ATCC 36951]|uniref:AB hydrolase-1 domain-containing protein n=1 Tax=Zasmidium cellare ATCC 36951 TaxID=1080233 RepID=A0A6A6C371_ZASCE|nr:uncharacterized protein M409DRAFT_59196 [Zasmidium cellare ATCC 36951]KAF2161501.1 hypothetical protein M409DRAFT_59196 [Zasmidium cellare ATCC 36951]